MVKGKIQAELIQDARVRLKCFKKRRMGILKKAMQLELITGCHVQIKIFNEQDESCLVYGSDQKSLKERPVESCEQYVKFTQNDYSYLCDIENQIQKYGHLNDHKIESIESLYEKLDGQNLVQLFSLATLPRFKYLDEKFTQTKKQKVHENDTEKMVKNNGKMFSPEILFEESKSLKSRPEIHLSEDDSNQDT